MDYNPYIYIMEYKIKVKSSEYNRMFLSILNFKLGLTNTELDIVSVLLDYSITVVDTKAREIIRIKLNKDKYTVANYISHLIDKQIFYRSESKVCINPSLLGAIKDGNMLVELTKEVDD